jgi:hypothetical protein
MMAITTRSSISVKAWRILAGNINILPCDEEQLMA